MPRIRAMLETLEPNRLTQLGAVGHHRQAETVFVRHAYRSAGSCGADRSGDSLVWAAQR
jgi:hypothetical protein